MDLHPNPVTSKSLHYLSPLDLLAAILESIFMWLEIWLHKYTGLCGPDSGIFFANFCNQVKYHRREIKHGWFYQHGNNSIICSWQSHRITVYINTYNGHIRLGNKTMLIQIMAHWLFWEGSIITLLQYVDMCPFFNWYYQIHHWCNTNIITPVALKPCRCVEHVQLQQCVWQDRAETVGFLKMRFTEVEVMTGFRKSYIFKKYCYLSLDRIKLQQTVHTADFTAHIFKCKKLPLYDEKETVIKLSYTINIFQKSNVKFKQKWTDLFPYMEAME